MNTPRSRTRPKTRTKPAEPLWTRDFIFAAVINFFVASIFYMFMTTMALYAVEELGAGDALAGLTVGIFIVGATAARIFAGKLFDLVGRKRILLVSMLFFLATSVGYFVTWTSLLLFLALSVCYVVTWSVVPLLTVFRLLLGVGFGAANTASSALAQSIIPASRRGEGTGYFAISTSLSTAAGPFLALTIVNYGGHTALFTTSCLATVAAMLAALVLRVPEVQRNTTEPSGLRALRLRGLIDRKVLPIAMFLAVLAMCYAGILAFLAPYAESLGLASAAPTFFIVFTVAILVCRPFLGRLQDSRGDNIVIYPALACYAAAFIVLVNAHSAPAIIVAGGLVGLGWGVTSSATQAIAVRSVKEERIGVAISTYFVLMDLGMGLGPVILGSVVELSGYRLMYGILACIIVIAGGMYWMVHGRQSVAKLPVRHPEET